MGESTEASSGFTAGVSSFTAGAAAGTGVGSSVEGGSFVGVPTAADLPALAALAASSLAITDSRDAGTAAAGAAAGGSLADSLMPSSLLFLFLLSEDGLGSGTSTFGGGSGGPEAVPGSPAFLTRLQNATRFSRKYEYELSHTTTKFASVEGDHSPCTVTPAP